MANINKIIREEASEFADSLSSKIIKALRGMPLNEMVAFINGNAAAKRKVKEAALAEESEKSAGKGKGKAAKAAADTRKAAAKPAKPAKRGRRTSEEVHGLVGKVADVINKSEGGIAISDIAKKLKVDADDLTRPIALGLSQNLFSKEGEKRKTRYFPLNGKTTAAAAAEAPAEA